MIKVTQIAKTLMILFLPILGLISYMNLNVELLPEFEEKIIKIIVKTEDTEPKENIEKIIRQINNSIKNISEISSIQSESNYNYISSTINIKSGSDIYYVNSQIEGKIKLLNLKEEISVIPMYLKLNDFIPALSIVIYGDKEDSDLFKITKEIKSSIEKSQDIQSVKVLNPKDEKIQIILDPEKMQSNGILAGIVISSLEKNNFRINKVGKIKNINKELDIILDSRLESIEEIRDLPIKNLLDKTIKLSEISEIVISREEIKNKIYYNGKNAVTLNIFKKDNGNLVKISSFVREVIKNTNIPDDIQVSITQDNLISAQKRVDDILSSLIISGIIISILVIIYLGIQNSIVIIISMLSTFFILCLALYLMSIKLNLFVMYSILVSLGVIIDNSIVLTEEMQKNLIKGNSVEKSYELAIKNTFTPLLSSLITTLIAFGTLFFMPNRIGQAVYFLPLTISITIIISFIVTIFFTGTLGSIFISPEKQIETKVNTSKITTIYSKILKLLFKYPVLVVAKIISILIIIPLILFYLNKKDNIVFTSDIEPNKVIIQIKDVNNSSVKEKIDIIKKLENYIQTYKTRAKETEITGIESRLENINNKIGQIIIYLSETKKTEDTDKIIYETSEVIKQNMPEINFNTTKEKFLSAASLSNNYDVNIEVYGPDYDKTLKRAKLLNEFIRNNLDDVKNVESDINNATKKQIKWKINRKKTAEYNINPDLIISEIAMFANDIEIGKHQNETDILLKYDDNNQTSEMLKKYKIPTKNGLIPLSTFVTEKTDSYPDKILSKNGDFLFLISLNTDKIYKVKKQINNWNKDNKENIKISFGRLETEEKEIYDFFKKSVLFSSIAMFIILYTQFKNPVKAFIGISSLIFVILGILIRSLIISNPFNILINSIGMMFLMGIAINNNIIIIDRYIKLRNDELSPTEAAIKACEQRLIPIILTSTTTILSMLLPAFKLNLNFSKMIIEYNSSSILWAYDMSTGIIFGMITSTLGSLFIIPIVIAYSDILFEEKKK